ncbi:MAG: hypothetical protein M1838_001702 [Thelocarpon superellum]|nr:MAG: hypothetical protein M1838_001702 [Thelocarpon superellum]
MADPLSISGGIVAVLQLAGTVMQYLNDVARASEERDQILLEISHINHILPVLKDLAERPQWGESWSTTIGYLNLPKGPLEQFNSALQRLASKLEPVRGLKRVERSLAWPFQKGEIRDILQALERQKTLFHLALQNDHIALSQAIRHDVEGVNNRVGELHQQLVQVQTSQAKQERWHQDDESQRVLDWLSPLNFSAQQSDIIARRQDGTGQWLLESAEFEAWRDGTRQTLFCLGIPGAGKTMLASIVIDHLSSDVRDHNIGLAYVFCNYQSQLEQTPTNLLGSLLRQLIPDGASVSDDLKNMYQGHIHKRTRPTPDELFHFLLSLMGGYSQVSIVVDALDECPNDNGTREWMLATLRSLQASNAVNLLFTSRYSLEISEAFKSDPKVEIRASEADVRKYLDGNMARLAGCVIKNTTLQENVKDEIVKAVDGMFLLVQLHLESLKDKISIKDVKTALRRLPKGGDALEKAYGEAVERIHAQQPGFRALARQVLSWITYAKRPLTVLELQHALAVEPQEPCLDPENLKDVEDMVSACAGLVTVEEESSHVRLVHYTTQEYLEGVYFTSDVDVQAEIATTCLTYLSFDAFEGGYCATDRILEDLLLEHPLFDYVAKHWGDYSCWNTGVPDESKALALNFLENEKKVSVSAQVGFASPYRYLGYSQRRGHEAVVRLLVDRDDVEVDSKDQSGQTPLSWAARGGHEAVVKLLVDRDDVEADSKDYYGQTPLSWAARGGQEAVVKLLLDRDDVEADSDDRDDQTPLAWAAQLGHEAAVKLLVDRDDVDVNARDQEGQTPLSWAARGGHEAVVKLLIHQNDIEADSKDEEGWTPLSLAAWRGHVAVVRLLLDRDDVDADSKDYYGQAPLSWAVRGGQEAVVKLLLDRDDVDMDCKDQNGQTPLLLAEAGRHEAVVKLLQAKAAARSS